MIREEMREVCLQQLDDVNFKNQEFVDRVHGVTERTVGRTNGKRKCVQNTWWNEDINKERQERRVKSRCNRLCAELDRGVDVRQEYERVWDEYRAQQKQVKFMV